MQIIYVIVKDVSGPPGHGEPGQEYYALAADGFYDKGTPYPAFYYENEAQEFIVNNKLGYNAKVLPLNVI